MTTRRDTLYRRALLVNSAVLVLGAALLAGTPATVSFPSAVAQLVIVACGVGAMIGSNAALLRSTVARADKEPIAAATAPTGETFEADGGSADLLVESVGTNRRLELHRQAGSAAAGGSGAAR